MQDIKSKAQIVHFRSGYSYKKIQSLSLQGFKWSQNEQSNYKMKSQKRVDDCIAEAGAAFIDLARIVPSIKLKWSRYGAQPEIFETDQAAWQDIAEWLSEHDCIVTMADGHVMDNRIKMNMCIEGMKDWLICAYVYDIIMFSR